MLVPRDAEAGVPHAERAEDPLAEKRLERLPGGALDQHPEDIGARVVHPALARLVHQRERAEAADPLVRRGRGLRARHPLPEFQLGQRVGDRHGSGRGRDNAEAHGEGEQVPDGDRPVRGHRVVELGVRPLQHLPVGQLGQQPVHRLVQPEQAFLDQDHGRGRGDRLGHRRDAEDRVAAHRLLRVRGHRADRVDVPLAPARDERHEAGHLAPLDVAGHHVVQTLEPLR